MAALHFTWQQPVPVHFGAGCLDDAIAMVGDVVVMAFEPAASLGLKERLSSALGPRLLDWIEVRDGLSTLARARELSERLWPTARRAPEAILLAIGGGTTLDLAKVVRCRPLSDEFEPIAAALRGRAPWPTLLRMPLWLAPTTGGTGSEVTRWATVWDTDGEVAVKRSLDEPFGYAQRAFVDPTLSASCPPAVTRDCALDALAHALEAIWNRHGNPVSDALALSAARRVLRGLPQAIDAPYRPAGHEQLALAALEAGLAFSQTRTALAHALSYALTLEQGLPHGLACAVWLPTVWRLSVGRDPRVDRLLGEVFGGDASAGASELADWLQELGVDARPAAWGVVDAPERIDAEMCSPRGRNFIGAPE